MESIVATIRSVLTSTKGKSDLQTLWRDYLMLMGTEIPFKKLGFNKLEDFLRACPTLSLTIGPNGQILVDAVTTEKTAHISSLVNRQKNPTKKRSKISTRRGPPQRAPRHSKQANWRPAAYAKKWQPSAVPSSRPATVAPGQTVSWNNQPTNKSNKHDTSRRGSQAKSVAILSPRSRAGLSTRSYSEDSGSSGSSYKKTPSPPPLLPAPPLVESEKSINARLKRTNSSPVNGVVGGTSRVNDTENHSSDMHPLENRLRGLEISCPRPRMRTYSNFAPTSPTFAAPTTPQPVQFASPILTPRETEELRQKGLAAVDPSSPIWNWSSSDESTPRGNTNSTDSSPENNKQVETRTPEHIQLEALSKKHNLGEMHIKVAPRKIKHGPIIYDCKIKIGSATYSSYPEDWNSAAAAQSVTIKRALKDITEKYERNEHLLVATDEDILERIPPIIKKHYHGVWADQIELDYQDLYNEQLPANWLSQIDTLPTISVERGIDKYFLQVCEAGQKNKGIFNAALAFDISVPSNTVKITDDGCVVQVTCALSTVEVWCREILTEEAEKYDHMCKHMDEYYYTKAEEPVAHIKIGGFYVVYYEETWCRVRALQVQDNEIMCFFIDYGDEYAVPKSNIFMLHRQFARQQAQAFVCQLAGLEELVNMSSASKYLEQLMGKEYLAKPIAVTKLNEEQDTETILSVVLYETSGPEEVTINQELIKQITVDSAVVNLEKETINKVYVTHADNQGNVFVQAHSEGWEKFTDLMNSLDAVDFSSEVPNAAAEPEKLQASTQLYLIRWGKDNKYYRCKLLDFSPDRQYAQIYFVDFGHEDIVTLAETALYPLELISDVLCLFPYQAVKVRLNLGTETLPDDFEKNLLKLLPSSQSVLLKITKTDKDNQHYCDLFKRSADHALFSVISSLLLEEEIPETGHEDGNNNDRSGNLNKKLQRIRSVKQLDVLSKKPVPSTGLLKPPVLPPLSEWFEIKIPCAVNPWNFFVQPYEMSEKLKELMQKLQDTYKTATHSSIKIEDVVPGKIYASKHDDGFWYRTSVIKVIHSGSISVFYCDFGYYQNLNISQLFPLDETFMELPYQAIKARLAGVKPKNVKWSMEDCKVFKELVFRRTFVSLLIDKKKDELYKYDIVLSLKLYDTSSNDDVELSKLLIEKDIAVPDVSEK